VNGGRARGRRQHRSIGGQGLIGSRRANSTATPQRAQALDESASNGRRGEMEVTWFQAAVLAKTATVVTRMSRLPG
jgi:hypothetical protein